MKTAAELEKTILAKAEDDTEFRAQLLRDPRGAIESATGVAIPEGFSINVHEENSTDFHLVLPASSRLSEQDLGQLSAGRHPDDPW